MSPEEAVAARVLDLTAVTTIVSTRVYVDKLPQKPTYPAVLVQLVHEPSDDAEHLRGGARRRARVQVDAYEAEANGTDPYGTVMALADAIRGDDAGSGLSGWMGNIGSPPFRVTGIHFIDRRRGYEPEEMRLLRQLQEYWIHFW